MVGQVPETVAENATQQDSRKVSARRDGDAPKISAYKAQIKMGKYAPRRPQTIRVSTGKPKWYTAAARECMTMPTEPKKTPRKRQPKA